MRRAASAGSLRGGFDFESSFSHFLPPHFALFRCAHMRLVIVHVTKKISSTKISPSIDSTALAVAVPKTDAGRNTIVADTVLLPLPRAQESTEHTVTRNGARRY